MGSAPVNSLIREKESDFNDLLRVQFEPNLQKL